MRTPPRRLVAMRAAAIFALLSSTALAASASAAAIVDDAACNTNVLPANDDGSTGSVALPFTVNFFGNEHSSLFVNNNGNVTFDSSMSTYTPFGLTAGGIPEVIGPFFGDVDTRGTGSDLVHYGATTFGGRQAFCVNWDGVAGVGYYSNGTDKLNKFQLLLVDRSDSGAGNFDIIFNYDQIQWETGGASGGSDGRGGYSAHVGYSNGSGDTGTFFELPGSGINGALLDSNASGLIHDSRNSVTPGRYIFSVRNGAAPTGGQVFGTVKDSNGNGIGGAPVQGCPAAGGNCTLTHANSSGDYNASGLNGGNYNVTASPPSGDSSHIPTTAGPATLPTDGTVRQDVTLDNAPTPPSYVDVSSISTYGNGNPVLQWQNPLVITATGCSGGGGHYEIQQDGHTIRSGSLVESSTDPGHYANPDSDHDPLYPNHGYVTFIITINSCPTAADNESTSFSAYIDPSGSVVDTAGHTVANATVTLLRSDTAVGPFDTVPNGSDIMSPANRNNPDTSDSAGHFGWDVIAGYYRVRATAPGCHAVGNPAQDFAESDVLTIPPAITNLQLTLECAPVTDPCQQAG